ncbi:hypothetical protein QFZ58_006559 [Streptomyces sp. B1I3]|nr:hypothetical protein [Streptomyces sp. B1I3]
MVAARHRTSTAKVVRDLIIGALPMVTDREAVREP